MRPDFVIIGAMKCGTSTLAAQLAAQAGVFMTTPKEPNFFSDDDVFGRGWAWYETLFAEAAEGDLKGEASTHYTKLPTYPAAAERLHAALPDALLIYMTRDPVERLISHYIHAWSMGEIDCPLEEAIDHCPELVEYGRYERQLAPYLARFGRERILTLRLEEMERDPQAVLDRVADFLGRPRAFTWRDELQRQNASRERIREFPFYRLLVKNHVATTLRRVLVPKSLRTAMRRRFMMRERPPLAPELRAEIERRLREEDPSFKKVASFPI